MKFNDLPIGAIASFHSCTFVKIKNADVHKRAVMQLPDAVDLVNSHYIVIYAEAECVLIKEPNDYGPRHSIA